MYVNTKVQLGIILRDVVTGWQAKQETLQKSEKLNVIGFVDLLLVTLNIAIFYPILIFKAQNWFRKYKVYFEYSYSIYKTKSMLNIINVDRQSQF